MTKLPDGKLDVKLIALDLDDTLLDDNRIVTEHNVEVLKKCAEKGIYVVLCSGRAEDGILPFVRQLGIAGMEAGRFIIAINGCSVFDMHKRLQIYKNEVDPEVLKYVNKVAESENYHTEVYSPTTIYYGTETKWTRLDVDMCGLKGEVVADYEKFLEKGFPKMLVPGEPEDVQRLQKKLKADLGDRAVIFTSKPFFLEIMPPNAGKGESVNWLAKHIGIGLDKVMVFGDSMNDESMIRKCHYGVAMKNGMDYIKEVADFVTEKTNNESGVGDFIEKFVL